MLICNRYAENQSVLVVECIDLCFMTAYKMSTGTICHDWLVFKLQLVALSRFKWILSSGHDSNSIVVSVIPTQCFV